MILSLNDLVVALPAPGVIPSPPERLFSIWEITTWILPMAPEHFRRTLAAHPDLPQGQAVPGAKGGAGSRWFTREDLTGLRRFFEARGGVGRYAPHRETEGGARVIALAGPLGGAGRSTVALHLAIAGALAGHRVLLVDADPAGTLAPRLGARPGAGGHLSVRIAAGAGLALRRRNERRVDEGEPPLSLPTALARAVETRPEALIAPTLWPGLEVVPGGAPLAGADPALADWARLLPGWSPARALPDAIAPWRVGCDLILIDTGPGLGPLALACLAGADALLVPVGAGEDAGREVEGLAVLSAVLDDMARAEAARAAALGEPPPDRPGPRGLILPVRTPVAGAALPVFPHLPAPAPGESALFWDRDYRAMGRLTYTPVRAALDACWTGLAEAVRGLDRTPGGPV